MTTSPGAASTSYDVDAIHPTLTGLDPRYRGSAAIHRVTGLDSGAMGKYGPMVSLFNDLLHGRLDPADTGHWHAENFSREAVAGQADRAEAIAQLLDRTEHEDAAGMARAAAGLHEYARAAREALDGRGPASTLAARGVTERVAPTSQGETPHPDWQAEMARQREEIRAAGQANGAAMHRRMAITHAQQIHLRESTGLVMPHPADMKAGAAHTQYTQASEHVLAGRFGEADEVFAEAISVAADSRDKGTVARLEKLRAKVASAALTVKPVPPALVRMAPAAGGTVTALDQHGTEHTIAWRDGQVTVTSPAGTLSGPDGGDPTSAARALAGLLAAQAPAATPDTEPEA